MNLFKQQVSEDIQIIQSEFIDSDPRVKQDNFAFNYWVLDRIYNIDEEIIPDQIVDYSDYGLDCFVHYEDSKELFLIQNKYYDENTPLDRSKVTDFLNTPLSQLKNESYKKNKELQTIFTKALNDEDYKINLHFYVTNNKRNAVIETLFNQFNIDSIPNSRNKCTITSKIFYQDDLEKLYYGESFEEKKKFKYELKTVNRGTILRILPEEYKLDGMSPAHYIMTPISVIYRMFEASIKKNYPLFEENIREYLGKSPVNNRIRTTLLNQNDRKNFFYYNNGITIICEHATPNSGNGFSIDITQPQIVNGCQTVNTIFEVLNDFAKKDETSIEREFGNVYVMVKVLIFNEEIKKVKPNFYKDIVKFTNSQNAISEKDFAADKQIFFKLQNELEQRGFLTLIQVSDKNTFKNKYKDKFYLNKLLFTSNSYASRLGLTFTTLADVTIPLEKLLQVYLSFMTNGYFAYSKKSSILNLQSEYYKNYSIKIHENLTYDNLVKLFLLFKKADIDKGNSEDKKTPIPYYLIGFLGNIADKSTPESISIFFNKVFENVIDTEKLYNYLADLTNFYKIAYKTKYNEDYNTMIKQKIDNEILNQQMELLNSMTIHKDAKKLIESLRQTL